MCSDETPEGLPELERRINLGSSVGWLPSIEPNRYAGAGSIIDSSAVPRWGPQIDPGGSPGWGPYIDPGGAPGWGPLISPDG